MASFKPSTKEGRWAAWCGVAVVAIWAVVVVGLWFSGPWDSSTIDSFWLMAPFYLVGLTGLGSLVFGITAVAKRERGILVYLASLLGLVIVWVLVSGFFTELS